MLVEVGEGVLEVSVAVDISEMLTGSEKINVSLPKFMIDRIARCVALIAHVTFGLPYSKIDD